MSRSCVLLLPKARGMTEISKQTGLSRESLYDGGQIAWIAVGEPVDADQNLASRTRISQRVKPIRELLRPGQEQDVACATLDVVDAVPGPLVDPELADAFAGPRSCGHVSWRRFWDGYKELG
jgi:hypothetical protein